MENTTLWGPDGDASTLKVSMVFAVHLTETGSVGRDSGCNWEVPRIDGTVVFKAGWRTGRVGFLVEAKYQRGKVRGIAIYPLNSAQPQPSGHYNPRLAPTCKVPRNAPPSRFLSQGNMSTLENRCVQQAHSTGYWYPVPQGRTSKNWLAAIQRARTSRLCVS